MGKKTQTADLQYDTAEEAKADIKKFNGVAMRGWTLSFDADVDDSLNVLVTGLPPDLRDGELEDVLAGDGAARAKPEPTQERVNRIRGPVTVGSLQFETAHDAKVTRKTFNGTLFQGCKLKITPDDYHEGGIALKVLGLPVGTDGRALKSFFDDGSVTIVRATTRKVETGWLGEVKFSQALFARKAAETFNKSWYGDNQIFVEVDTYLQDGTKIRVKGLPDGVTWKDLKEYFSEVGTVISTNLREMNTHITNPEKKRKLEEELTGVIKYEDEEHLLKAEKKFNNSCIGAVQITVEKHATENKLMVYGLSRKVNWEALCEHFGSVGAVDSADIQGADGASIWGDDSWDEAPGSKKNKNNAWDSGGSW